MAALDKVVCLLGVEIYLSQMAQFDRGCVKAQNNFIERKIDFLKRSLCDFLDLGKGVPTHRFLSDLRFYTASATSRHPSAALN